MPSPPSPRRLTSWKEIAAFLGKAERTVKRWEAERGLPVHRIPGKGGGGIWADPEELTRWLVSAPEPATTADASHAEPPPPQEPTAAAERTEGRAGPPRVLRRGRLLWWAAPAGLIAALLVAGLVVWPGLRRMGQADAAPRDPEAAELYREGLHDWNTRTPAGLNRAVDEFTQAIVRDPRDAQSYAGLANCYILLREFASMSDADAYPRAEAAARRAVALNPALPRAHSALAFVLFYWRWRPAQAETEFRTALRLAPDDALIHHWYANVLKVRGRAAQAEREIDRAQALDPDSSAILADKASIYASFGRTEDARAILQHMAQVDPGFGAPHQYLSDLDLLAGDDQGFLEEQRRLAASRGESDKDVRELEAARRAGGPAALHQALLRRATARFDRGAGTAYDVARFHAVNGDTAAALAWVGKSLARREPPVLGFSVDPAMAQVNRAAGAAPLRRAILGRS